MKVALSLPFSKWGIWALESLSQGHPGIKWQNQALNQVNVTSQLSVLPDCPHGPLSEGPPYHLASSPLQGRVRIKRIAHTSHLRCARRCSELFTFIGLLHPHNSVGRPLLSLPSFYRWGKLKFAHVRQWWELEFKTSDWPQSLHFLLLCCTVFFLSFGEPFVTSDVIFPRVSAGMTIYSIYLGIF